MIGSAMAMLHPQAEFGKRENAPDGRTRAPRLAARSASSGYALSSEKISRKKRRGPLSRAFSVIQSVMMSTMTMPLLARRRTHIRRTKIDIDHAGRGAEAGLALEAQRLQRDRVAGTTDQQVRTDPDADRRVRSDSAEMAGQRAAAQPSARRMDDPCQTGLLSDAEVEAKALDTRDVGFRRRTGAATEDALKFRCGTNDIAHMLAAPALEDAGLDPMMLILGLGARNRRDEGHGGRSEKFWEVHE